MDKREKEFDDSVRRKLSEKFVDFDESAWNEMAQRLQPDHRPVRRMPVWLGAAAAVVVTGLCVWAIFMYDREEVRPVKEKPLTFTPDESAQENRPDSPVESAPVHSGGREADLQTEIPERSPSMQAFDIQVYPVKSQILARPVAAIAHEHLVPDPGQLRTVDRLRTLPESVLPETGSEDGRIKLSLGILAAPDLNGLAGFAGSKVGYNLGFSAGLHFSDRLSLHSGINYSRKPYDALPGDYKNGYTPPTLVNIAAVCDVIDIPVNIRYAVYTDERDRVSLNAGLSTYLMLNEQYTYEYADRQDAFREYTNENRHFMGVGNLAVVLERRINDKASVSLEPFVKVPLTGIGQGRVRLLTAGAGVRLNLDLSKKQQTLDK